MDLWWVPKISVAPEHYDTWGITPSFQSLWLRAHIPDLLLPCTICRGGEGESSKQQPAEVAIPKYVLFMAGNQLVVFVRKGERVEGQKLQQCSVVYKGIHLFR